MSINKKAVGKIINIGTGKDISIKETADTIMNIMKYRVPIVSQKIRLRPKKSEVNRLVADNGLLNSLIKKIKLTTSKQVLKQQ